MQQLTLESPAWLLPVIAIVAFIAARYLYKKTTGFSKTTNYLLLFARTTLLFILLLLLLEPILKLTKIIEEKPLAAIVSDRSASILLSTDSAENKSILKRINQLKIDIENQGFEVKQFEIDSAALKSNLTLAIQQASGATEDKRINKLILASDGLYNEGISPINKDFPFEIYTVGLGDSTSRKDLIVRNLTYNKIAYQGNQFPVLADISTTGFEEEELTILAIQNGKQIDKQKIKANQSGFATVEFTLKAESAGLQRILIQVEEKTNEWNKMNNAQTAFIEVVSGKKKILALAQAPHPDLKAMRAAIESNDNYQFDLVVDGIPANDIEKKIDEADLIIFYQIPNSKGRNTSYARALNTKASFLYIIGEQSNWPELLQQKIVLAEAAPRQKDEAFASVNSNFNQWQYSEELVNQLTKWPPLTVPFIKYTIPPDANVLCFQQVGSVVTNKPLLWLSQNEMRKSSVFLGEGFWKWKLQEYNQSESQTLTNEFWNKLIQYLSTTEDKSRFRCFPITKEFQQNESVVFETQMYNQLYEPIYGKQVTLTIKGEQSNNKSYQFTTAQGDSKFTLGNLPEGIYTYSATTILDKEEKVKGEFFVSKNNIELANTQADFSLLRNLSVKTGGKFYLQNQVEELAKDIQSWEAIANLETEDSYNPLINLFLIFLLIVILVSFEWFVRKYNGSY